MTLAPCAATPYVDLEVDLTQPVGQTWSHQWTDDQSDSVSIPGASISFDVASAGLVADVGIGGPLDAMSIWVGFDVCGSVLDISYCGSDLTTYIPQLQGYIPLVVFNGTFDLSNACNSVGGTNRTLLA